MFVYLSSAIFLNCRLNNDELYFTIPKSLNNQNVNHGFILLLLKISIFDLFIPDIDCDAIFYLGQGDRRYQKVPIRLIYNINIPLLSDYLTVTCDDPKKKIFYPKLPYASIHYNPTVSRTFLANIKKA